MTSYDPLFNKYNKKQPQQVKEQIEVTASVASPMSGSPMLECFVGDALTGEKIPVLASMEDRICLPMEK